MNRKQYRHIAFGTGIATLSMLEALKIDAPTKGAFGYRFENGVKHNPRKIENKPMSKRVLRKIMIDKFIEGA